MMETKADILHMRGLDAHKTRALVDGLVQADDPAAAIRGIVARADDPRADAVERYIGSILRDADAGRLCSEGVGALMSLKMLPSGERIRVVSSAGPAFHQQAMSLEDALNRALGLCEALTEGVGAWSAKPPAGTLSRHHAFEALGLDYPLWSDGRRNAHVILPAIPPTAAPTEAYFNEVDWRSLDNVASNAHLVFQSALLANLNRTVLGIATAAGSEWDVRTRLAAILEDLEPPLRFAYRFDCDTAHNMATVRFSVPPASSLPTRIAVDGQIEPTGSRAKEAQMVYALRLAALLGAACFGSGRRIDQAIVVGVDAAQHPLLSCAFERTRFVQETLYAIDDGRMAAPELRFDVEAVKDTLGANRVDCAQALPGAFPSALASIQPDGNLEWSRPDPASDGRVLPPELQRLFRARHAKDVDTSHYLGGSAEIIDEARADSEKSLIAAVAHLEGVVADMERRLEPPEDDPDARPLYCRTPLSRVALALLDDELNVADQAEAFLHPNGAHEQTGPPSVTYYRAPDALFQAHVGLSDLYQRLGDLSGSEAHADRCIALGPTTAIGYARKADVLADRGRVEQAANVLMEGLRYTLAEHDCAFLYHHLALMLWHLRHRHAATAVYAYTATLGGLYGDKALEFVAQVSGATDARAFARANRADALREMEHAGIPIAPNRAADALVARATVELANAHFPAIAAPYAEILAKRFAGDRAITGACRSIQFGAS